MKRLALLLACLVLMVVASSAQARPIFQPLPPPISKPKYCPPGQYWSVMQRRCVPNQPAASCPNGFHWSARLGRCVANRRPQCPEGWHWSIPSQDCVPNP